MPKTRPAELGDALVQVNGRRRPLSDDTVRRAVSAVLRGERRAAVVSVTFLGRDAMQRLNARYLGRNRPTDVIAFSLAGPDGTLTGDVYLCPWFAEKSARNHRIPLRQELIRLVVHGTLHVLGCDHPEGAERSQSPMWRRQERYVEALT